MIHGLGHYWWGYYFPLSKKHREDKMMKQMLINFTPEQYEALRRVAFERKKSMAWVVRQALEKALKENILGTEYEVHLCNN